jgi:phenylpropionate dioxygenase-like ring-hydroxylating dioxygenase large terminal subunit
MGWSVPDWLDTWYLVAGADEVGAAQVLPFQLAGERGVMGRTPQGLAALRSRCPHMGADLGAGWLQGDRFVCPLHGLSFGPDGQCDRRAVEPVRPFPVQEGCGSVFAHPTSPSGPAPRAERWPDLVWAPARAERVELSWQAIVVNAFDMHHLQVVHRRALVREPELVELAPDRLRLSYATRVTGRGLSDRLMQAFVRDHIDIWVTCVGGPVLVVEVDLGRTRTAAMVGLVPDGTGTVFRLAVGVPTGTLAPVGARLARWLYFTFIRRDVPALSGAVLDPASDLPEDLPVQRLVAFLEGRRGL